MNGPLLLEYLNRFNRKERYFVVGRALGSRRFSLSDDFRNDLAAILGTDVPASAQGWMDYHLDWVYASIVLAEQGKLMGVFDSPQFPGKVEGTTFNVNTNQEDTDLLVGFVAHDATAHLVFVEAKGYLGWGNAQLQSKAKRLTRIFGSRATSEVDGVVPHFVILSPEYPKGLKTTGLPAWMCPDQRFAWLQLVVPVDRLAIERCDSAGNPQLTGQFWHIKGLPLAREERAPGLRRPPDLIE